MKIKENFFKNLKEKNKSIKLMTKLIKIQVNQKTINLIKQLLKITGVITCLIQS